MQIHTNSAPAGLGYELDRHLNPATSNSPFTIRECAGVPDAVLLDLGDPHAVPPRLPTVGVAFPHQFDFGDYPSGAGDDSRRFDLRLVTCSLDASNTLSKTLPFALRSNTRFDGPSAPMSQESAGLVLPDLAPGTVPYGFWLTFEEQNGLSGGIPLGRVMLEFWQGVSATSWPGMPEASVSFGSLTSPAARRRPNVASYPAAGGETVSIAFSREVTANDGDVVYEEWVFTPSGPTLAKVAWPVGAEFPNDDPAVVDDIRPVPLHGRTGIRQVLVDRNGSPCLIVMYTPINNPGNALVQKASSSDGLGRPAVAYRFHGSSGTDNFALTWEQVQPNPPVSGKERIWLRVD